MRIFGWYAEGLVLTVVMECAAAWLLGIRGRRNMLRVALVQLLTNPLVLSVVALALRCGVAPSSVGYGVVVGTLEVAVVPCEAALLTALVPRKDLGSARIRNAMLLSLLLNAVSFLAGGALSAAMHAAVG